MKTRTSWVLLAFAGLFVCGAMVPETEACCFRSRCRRVVRIRCCYTADCYVPCWAGAAAAVQSPFYNGCVYDSGCGTSYDTGCGSSTGCSGCDEVVWDGSSSTPEHSHEPVPTHNDAQDYNPPTEVNPAEVKPADPAADVPAAAAYYGRRLSGGAQYVVYQGPMDDAAVTAAATRLMQESVIGRVDRATSCRRTLKRWWLVVQV